MQTRPLPPHSMAVHSTGPAGYATCCFVQRGAKIEINAVSIKIHVSAARSVYSHAHKNTVPILTMVMLARGDNYLMNQLSSSKQFVNAHTSAASQLAKFC